MSWYNFLKFLHIVAVIICVGGLFARQLVRAQAKKTNDIRLFATYNQAAGKIESSMVIPGMMAILVLGIILALIGDYPILGFLQGASTNWLLVSNLLILGSIVIVPTVFIPRGKKFEPVLEDALAQGQITPELRTAMDDRVVNLAHRYEEISVIVVTALMVLKPF
jgi:uncharacterized membrane protein